MDKVANFIRQGDGRFLLLKLAKVSHLYKNVGKTAEKVRNGEVRVYHSLSLPAPSLPVPFLQESAQRRGAAAACLSPYPHPPYCWFHPRFLYLSPYPHPP
jgi:hypothetical protein